MPQAAIKHHGFFGIALLTLLLFVAMAAPALAQIPVHAVWQESPGSGDWNTAGHWECGIAPVKIGDTAAFNTSTITALSLSNDVTINSMTFNSGASAFTINTVENS